MKHFTSFLDFSPHELLQFASRAEELKRGSSTDALKGKILALLFFNPSLRTRVSFEASMIRFGGNAITLSAGGDVWGLESEEGVVMDAEKPEHIKDAARVLSRYCDAIAIRCFADMNSIAEDLEEKVVKGFERYSTVPVISMESAMEHPCQALADMVTIREQLPQPMGKKLTLIWAPHVKPRPLAVPHSAALCGATLGMDVTIVHPEGYDLAEPYLNHVKKLSEMSGATFSITSDRESGLKDADIVQVKSWGNTNLYGDRDGQIQDLARYRSWIFSKDDLPLGAKLMHCLPVRRNVEVSDGALDCESSVIIDQAENRLWAQSAVLESILGVM